MAKLGRSFSLLQSANGEGRPFQDSEVLDRSIGDILKERCGLTDASIQRIVDHARLTGQRFGAAATDLGLVGHEDVVWALSQQFHYPYLPEVAGTLPGELIAAVHPFSEAADSFRDLRSRLLDEVMNTEPRHRLLAILSCDPKDGKSYVAANLAISFSQLGGRVLLVDGNLRNPSLGTLFRIPQDGGLSGILSGRQGPNLLHQVEGLPSLYVLQAGPTPPNPLELVQRPGFELLMTELLAKFDYVFLDTPSWNATSDARVIATKCGSALIVGRKHFTRLAHVGRVIKTLKRAKVQFGGIVLNDG